MNGPAPPNAAGQGSPRPLTHLKHHLLQKGYGNQSPTSPQSFVNGPAMHQPMGPPQMQHLRMQVCYSNQFDSNIKFIDTSKFLLNELC